MLELTERRVIHQDLLGAGQLHGFTLCHKTVPAFVGLAGQRGADAQECQIFAAVFHQLLGRQAPAVVVIRGHAGGAATEIAVDGHRPHIRGNLQVGVVGQGNDAIHLVLRHHLHHFLLLGVVVFRIAQQHPIAAVHQRPVDVVCHHTKERVEQIGQDDRHGVGAVVLQPLGVGVDVVVQRLDGLFYLFTVLVTHWDAVDDLGYSAQRDPCLLGHILHSRGGVLFCHAGHSFVRETFLFQVDIYQRKSCCIPANSEVFAASV